MRWAIFKNKLRTFFGKPQNTILVLMGLICTFSTFAPIIAIVEDTLKIHVGSIDQYLTGKASGYTFANYVDLFTGNVAKANLWTPLLNTLILAACSCVVAILFGGVFAFLITHFLPNSPKYLIILLQVK